MLNRGVERSLTVLTSLFFDRCLPFRRSCVNDLTQSSGEWLRGSGPESDIVISSRIRLARNLADFPFISRATEADRAEIETTLQSHRSSLHEKDDFTGESLYVDVRRSGRSSTASSSSSAN